MFIRYTFFSIVWAFVILLLTLMPGNHMPHISYIISFDKIAHAFVFAIQSLLLIVAFTKQYSFQFVKENSIFLAVIISTIYGLVIELAQSFIPGRAVELGDLVADSLGSIVGWGFFYLIYKLEF